MMKFKTFFQTVSAVAFTLMLGVSTATSEEVKILSAAEIKEAFVGNTMDHEKVYVFWAPDGMIKGKSKRGPTDTGKYAIKDDGTYCRAWNEWRGGNEQCGQIGKVGDLYARIVDGEVQSQFKILKGNPEGL